MSKQLLPLEVALANQSEVILSILGFSFGGWQTSKQSLPLEVALANQALVKAITPVCAEMFKRNFDYKNNSSDYKKIEDWSRCILIENSDLN
jgi:hypothetical protein